MEDVYERLRQKWPGQLMALVEPDGVGALQPGHPRHQVRARAFPPPGENGWASGNTHAPASPSSGRPRPGS